MYTINFPIIIKNLGANVAVLRYVEIEIESFNEQIVNILMHKEFEEIDEIIYLKPYEQIVKELSFDIFANLNLLNTKNEKENKLTLYIQYLWINKDGNRLEHYIADVTYLINFYFYEDEDYAETVIERALHIHPFTN